MWIQKSRLDAEQFDTRLPNISSSSKLRNQIPQNRVPQNLYFFVSNLKEKDRTNIWLFHIQSRKKKAMAKYYVISSDSSLLCINYGGGLKMLLALPSSKLKHLTRTFEIAWCRGSLSTRRIKIKTSSAPILFCATGWLAKPSTAARSVCSQCSSDFWLRST